MTRELRLRLAEGDTLEQPQEICGGKNRAKRSDHHVNPECGLIESISGVVRRQDRRELTPEPRESRQSERCHAGKPEDPAHSRHLLEEPTETLDFERVISLLDASCHEEQHARDETVRHHAEHGGIRPERRQRRDAEHDKSHVCNRRERDQTLHVSLREASECSIDDADHGQRTDVRCPLFCRRRQDRNCDTNEAVRSQLEQYCRQDDGALRWRLGVRIGQPGVERKHRHLDGETNEHSRKDPDLDVLGDRGPVFNQVRNRETFSTGLEEQREECNKHERGTEHRVEEELQRRVLAILTTPHTDHEVHRQKHQFEEHEEQDEVLSDERSCHAGLQNQHQ